MRGLLFFLFLIAMAIPARPAPEAPKDSGLALFSKLKKENDPSFTPKERRLIKAAHDYVDRLRKKSTPAKFAVGQIPEGYEVLIQFVDDSTGNSAHEMVNDGGFCWIDLDSTEKVIRLRPGE